MEKNIQEDKFTAASRWFKNIFAVWSLGSENRNGHLGLRAEPGLFTGLQPNVNGGNRLPSSTASATAERLKPNPTFSMCECARSCGKL